MKTGNNVKSLALAPIYKGIYESIKRMFLIKNRRITRAVI